MTDMQTQDPPATDDDALRKRLIGRIAVAVVIILGLLGSLAMVDALNAPEPVELAASVPAAAPPPAPAPPAAAPTAEEKPAAPTALPPPPPETPSPVTPAPAAARSAPEQTASPGAPPLAPLPAEKPLTKPAVTRQAAVRPIDPAPAARPDPQRELARAPWSAGRHAPASRPLSQSPAAPPPGRQFALQLGVFNNLANAEELHKKLEQAGIPSIIEARVQVGPFKSREDLEATREKLRALGMETGIMVSMKK